MDTSTGPISLATSSLSIKVVKAPDPRLKIQTKPVKKIDQSLKNTLNEMVKLTKTFKDPEGVGLASTQVGLDRSFFVAKKGEGFISVINPKIISAGKRTKKYFEGCLSVPNMWGEVRRATNIRVSYQNTEGKTIIAPLKGIPAWIFQHEIDHLNGILFSNRVLEQKGKFYRFTGKDKTGADMFEEVTI